VKNKPLSSFYEGDQAEWTKIGQRLQESIITHVRERKYFNASKPYSARYAKRKAANKAAPKGVPSASTSRAVDLTLSGKMLDDTRVSAKPHEAVLTWLGFNAEKLQHQADQGRDVLGDGDLIPPVMNELEKDLDKMYELRLRSLAGTTTVRV